MKSRIVMLLQSSEQPVSGQLISEKLGISRVAVWKHIHQLQAAGFAIESTPKGYRLLAEPETPLPWLFGRRAPLIHHFGELDTTMNKALELARNGCPPFTVVIADHQTAGRGRLMRRWHAEAGGLYFTMVLRPDFPHLEAAQLNLAAALDWVSTLSDVCGIQARVKWPNDVLVDGRKIAGILSQMESEEERIAFINIGIGVNLNNDPGKFEKTAVSAIQLTGSPVSRVRALICFLDRFETRLKNLSQRAVLDEWRRVNVTLGRQVTIQTVGETVKGKAIDIDESGGLILALPGGQRKTVHYGDCFHRD